MKFEVSGSKDVVFTLDSFEPRGRFQGVDQGGALSPWPSLLHPLWGRHRVLVRQCLKVVLQIDSFKENDSRVFTVG